MPTRTRIGSRSTALAGRVVIEDTVRRYSFHPAGSETGEVWQAGYFNDLDREFHRTFDMYMDALLPAFRRGDAPPVPATAGRRALLLALASVRSFEIGRRVRIGETDFAGDAISESPAMRD